jgi:hypothetical protein
MPARRRKQLIAMLSLQLQHTAAAVLKRSAATPQAFERATGLRVLHMSPAVVVVDKPTGLRSVPAYGPTRALLADFAKRQAAGEADLQAKFERPTRRDRWFVLSVISELFRTSVASMASSLCPTASTPSTWPSESLHDS